MTAPVTESLYLSDLLVYEAEQRYSRESITVAAGQSLTLGTLLGRVTDSGAFTAWNPKAKDGSDRVLGVLLADCDASVKEAAAVMVTRHALLSDVGIQWGDLSAEQQRDAQTQLAARGIVIRKGV